MIPENSWEQKVDDIRRYHIDTVVMGSNWEGSRRFEYLRDYCELVYLPRTEGVSTSKIRRDLLADAVTDLGTNGHEPPPVTSQMAQLDRTA